MAAGITWTRRTANAEWGGRYGHTSVVDAVSGAIYVIGGRGGDTFFQDVWVSTNGGARPDSVGGLVQRVHWVGTTGVLRACVACACAARLCEFASWLCGRCGGTAGTGGINSSAGGAGRPRVRGCDSVRSALGVARVGGRYHLHESYDQRGMGRALAAHVRDRRRRRHLRHRRLGRRRQCRHHLQRRVGQHQWRCAAGLGRGVVVGGYTRLVLRGYSGAPRGYYRGTTGVLRGYYGGT